MQTSSVKKNYMYQVIYKILTIILPLATSPYVSRVVGTKGLGIYSYSYSVAHYFVLFAMLGLVNYGNRIIAQVRDDQDKLNEVFSNVAVLHILFSAICMVVYVIYAFFFAEDRIFAIIQLIYVFSGLIDISWFYFGIEKFKITVTWNIIIKLVNFACIFIFVKNADDLWKYTVILTAGYLLNQLVLWFPLKRFVTIVKPEWSKMKEHIKPMLILFIPVLAVSLYRYMDKIMIGVLSDKEQLGLYENADKFTYMPLDIIVAFGTVMLPKMSNLAASSNEEASEKYISLSMKYVMCMAFAMGCGIAGISKIVAPVFWGEDFRVAGMIILGLSITIPFMSFANIIRTQYLIPRGMDKEYVISVVCGAVINLIINIILIPQIGAFGATMGTVFTEILVCVIQAVAVKDKIDIKKYLKNATPFLIFGVCMFAAVFVTGSFMGERLLTLVVQICLGGVVYSGLSALYFVKTKDEYLANMLKKFLNGRKKES